MKNHKKLYYNKNWFDFSNLVKSRDGFKCLKCHRKEPDVILQTHHKNYKPNLKPWEYPLSDCITLCKGCHARIHGIIEPEYGWELIYIGDLGGLEGICERKGCGREIRYEHLIFHPQWGEKIVGSTCVEYLSQEDQILSVGILKIFKTISDFIDKAVWKQSITKKGKPYLFTIHNHHRINIYGKEGFYSFQVALKTKGEKWMNYKDFIKVKNNKNLEQVKELSFLVLKGLTAQTEREKKILRNIYANTR